MSEFILRSDDLSRGQFAPAHLLSEGYGFGCDGGNVSPHLAWQDPPKGTKSYVLTMYDKDAPTGIGWMHWVVTRTILSIAKNGIQPGLPRRSTIICCRNTRISASIAARRQIRSTTIPKISLQRSDIHGGSSDSAFHATG